MSLDSQYVIDTPENIEFRYDVAGIGSRFLAAIVDTTLLILIQVVLSVVMGVLVGQAEASEVTLGPVAVGVTSLLIALWGLLGFIFFWGYYIFFEMVWNGQSPGKRAMRLRVVREGGRPITFVASAVRNLIRVVDFLPLLYGLGVVVMFADKRVRRLGDLAGGTLVVKEQHAVSLETLTRRTQEALPPLPSELENLPLLPNISALKETDYDLVQEFLRRRSELGRESRFRLGTELAEKVRGRMGMTFDQGQHEPFLERVAFDYRRAHQEANRPQSLAQPEG